jgi:MFS family permease
MKPSAATAIPDDRQSERVTRYAWKALAGSAIGYAMDGFDLLILSFMLPEITAALKLTTEQGGALVTWTLIGAVLGGMLDMLVTLFLIPELKGGELDSPDPGRVRSNWQAHPRKLKHRSLL